MNDIPPRAVAYLRVSTEEQRERSTIDNQREYAESFSRLHQIPILDWYLDDGVSGTVPFDKRPEGTRLLADARAGHFNLVLVTRIDRLARSTLELLRAMEHFDREGVAMRSMSEPFETSTNMGRFVLTMLGSIAQLEKETIKERSRQGMERLARAGRWNGGKPPYGYRVNSLGYLEIDEEQAAVVRRIFHLYTEERQGTVRIAALLTAEGVPMPKIAQGVRRQNPVSGQWSPSTISRILRNPNYIGTHTWRKQSVVHEQGEAIGRKATLDADQINREIIAFIPVAVFEKAARLLKRNFAWSTRNTKREYLLRGLIRCADCGHLYSGISPADRPNSYYHHPKKSYCDSHYIDRPTIEAAVWNDIMLHVQHPNRVVDRLAEQMQVEAERAAPIQREFGGIEEAISGKQAERRRLIGLARRGVVTEGEAEYELGQLQQEIDALETRRSLLFSQQEQSQALQNRLVSAPLLLRSFTEKVTDEAFASRREVVEELVASIRVQRETTTLTNRILVAYCFDSGPGHVLITPVA